jgi:hypothetical protein
LLKNIGAVGAIELPELLSSEKQKPKKPNDTPPTDDTQQENESYESESEDDEDTQPYWQEKGDVDENQNQDGGSSFFDNGSQRLFLIKINLKNFL